MDILSKAPLIEVIFELRWGPPSKSAGDANVVPFEFPLEDTELFFGQFHGAMVRANFGSLERINVLPGGVSLAIPHAPTHRYRRAPNTWPCYQVGLGIFTANQLNEGYTWAAFKQTVVEGLGFLNEGHPKGLVGLPLLGMELRYQDGFVFQQTETANDFLRDKLAIRLELPRELASSDRLSGSPETRSLSIHVNVKKPKAVLICNLRSGKIGGKRGYIMNTMVRSADDNKPERADIASISNWLEDAHFMQELTFKSLIHPTFAKSLA